MITVASAGRESTNTHEVNMPPLPCTPRRGAEKGVVCCAKAEITSSILSSYTHALRYCHHQCIEHAAFVRRKWRTQVPWTGSNSMCVLTKPLLPELQ